MNKKLAWIMLFTAIGVSGCTFNVGTGNTANATASNTAPSAPATAPSNTASAPPNTAKNSGTSSSSLTGANDPKSDSEQLKFAKGQTDTTIERTLYPGVNKTYLLNARKGQIMWFKVDESTGQLGVDFNRRSVELGEEVRQELNASGDWAIYIHNSTDKPLNYKLWVGIE